MIRRIRQRYQAARSILPNVEIHLFAALKGTLADGYKRADLQADIMAGLVVGIVALPLSMALAIATGVAPQHGLYTAIVAGGVIALLGGSRTQVSGPTAAFVVVLTPITARFGLAGLLMATMMAGAILVLLGVLRLGKLIQYIPYPVTTGFTAGIGVVIATLQLKDLLGLEVAQMPEHYLERVGALIGALPTAHASDLGVGIFTLAVLLIWPRVTKRVPAPLIALTAASLLIVVVALVSPSFEVATIGSRFSHVIDGVTHPGIPRLPPLPVLPWTLGGAEGRELVVSYAMVRELMPSAFAIAMLGGIESLLSAVVSDGMAGTKSDPDGELIAQGIGNIAAPFFGGFAATGAIARTATNVRSGARSPIAAVVHAIFLLGAVVLLAPLVAYLPMASLAALLLVVAWNMSEPKHFLHVVRVAPKSDVFVQLTCFSLTVLFDMVIAVTVGIVLAALLFMRRMAEITGARLAEEKHPALREPLPKGVFLYEIAGPLFFGAAQKAMSSLEGVMARARVLILDITAVPAIDATSLVNLESAIARMHRSNGLVILAGVQPQPRKVLRKALTDLAMVSTVELAVELARKHIDELPPPPTSRRPPSSRPPVPSSRPSSR